jgi:ABC-type transporter Mla maintaining outer membrane lipid asymmetry ATPase subunit MlaF
MAAPLEGHALTLSGVFQHVGARCCLAGIDLEVARGEWLLIIGPNGAGKSLLTRLIMALDSPSAGSVRVLGEDVAGLGWDALCRLRGRMGAVLQGGSLIQGRDVLENLLLPLRRLPGGRAHLARQARLVVALLQLDGLEGEQPRALSLGQRRRVELARALIHAPELLVWDGLTDGLDPGAARDALRILAEQRETRRLTLVATDNRIDDLARSYDRVAVLERGRLLFQGTPAELEEALPQRLDLRFALLGRD